MYRLDRFRGGQDFRIGELQRYMCYVENTFYLAISCLKEQKGRADTTLVCASYSWMYLELGGDSESLNESKATPAATRQLASLALASELSNYRSSARRSTRVPRSLQFNQRMLSPIFLNIIAALSIASDIPLPSSKFSSLDPTNSPFSRRSRKRIEGRSRSSYPRFLASRIAAPFYCVATML